MAVVENPILEDRAREQGGSVCKVGNGTKDQGIGGGGRFDVTSESEVECLDDHWFGNDGGVNIIRGGVNGISTGEGGRTFQMISKSWRKRDQRACRRDSLRGSFI